MAKIKLNVAEKIMSDMCNKMAKLQDKEKAQDALIKELVEGLKFTKRFAHDSKFFTKTDALHIGELITKAEREG